MSDGLRMGVEEGRMDARAASGRRVWMVALLSAGLLGGVLARADAFESRVFLSHSPIQPQTSGTGFEGVTYSVTVNESQVLRIKIYESQFTAVDCGVGQTQPPCLENITPTTGHSEQLLTTCNNPTTCSFTEQNLLATANFVGYRAQAETSIEVIDGDYVYYALGNYPWQSNPATSDPIPFYIAGTPQAGARLPLSKKLDIVFVPDTNDYVGSNWQSTFRTDVANLLWNAYMSVDGISKEIRPRRGDWNLYLSYVPANIANPCPTFTQAANYDHLYQGGIDANAIVYTDTTVGPCTQLPGQKGAQFGAPAWHRAGTIHETGHAMYRLSDEYNGGAVWENAVRPNAFKTKPNCQDPVKQCVQNPQCVGFVPRKQWHRSDVDGDVMQWPVTPSSEFRLCDQQRIGWKHDECAAQNC